MSALLTEQEFRSVLIGRAQAAGVDLKTVAGYGPCGCSYEGCEGWRVYYRYDVDMAPCGVCGHVWGSHEGPPGMGDESFCEVCACTRFDPTPRGSTRRHPNKSRNEG